MVRLKIAVILSAVVFASLWIACFAHGEIFRWTDEKGTIHFTEDPTTIPEKYKDKVKSRTTDEDMMSPEERARARKRYEEEVMERLKQEQRKYDAKELEKRVKENVDQTQRQKEDRQRERERDRERAAATLESDLRSQGLTACQREMLTHAAALGSEKLRNEAKRSDMTCSQREALVNAERLRRGLEPIKFTAPPAAASSWKTGEKASPTNPGAIDTRTGEYYPGVPGGIINPRTGDFMPATGGGYVDPKTGRVVPKTGN